MTDDLDKAYRFDEFLNLPSEYDDFLASLATDVMGQQGIRFRQDVHNKLKSAASIILANLLNARSAAIEISKEDEAGTLTTETQGGWLSISLNSNDYINTRYNNSALSYRSVEKVLRHLRNEENELGIEEARGFLDRGTGVGKHTRIKLNSISYNTIINNKNKEKTLNPNLKGLPFIANITSYYPVSLLVHDTQKEVIRLKDDQKALIDYVDTPEVIDMRNRLREWNAFSLTQRPDIFLTNDQFVGLQDADLDGVHADAYQSAGETHTEPTNLCQRVMYRVFNNESWGRGGRLYGGWWQGVPSKLRNRITINARPTVEIDYSNMQAAMIYAKEHMELPEDAYSLDGIDGSYRKLIKTTFFQMINAREGQQIRAPKDENLPPDVTFKELREMIARKHEPIAGYFNTGIGLELQKIDAEIALDVMHIAMGDGELVLPIHDSFIAKKVYGNSLREIMRHCYQERIGQYVDVDDTPPFQHTLTLEAPQGDEFHEIDVDIDDLIVQDDYSGYRGRHEAAFVC